MSFLSSNFMIFLKSHKHKKKSIFWFHTRFVRVCFFMELREGCMKFWKKSFSDFSLSVYYALYKNVFKAKISFLAWLLENLRSSVLNKDRGMNLSECSSFFINKYFFLKLGSLWGRNSIRYSQSISVWGFCCEVWKSNEPSLNSEYLRLVFPLRP